METKILQGYIFAESRISIIDMIFHNSIFNIANRKIIFHRRSLLRLWGKHKLIQQKFLPHKELTVG